MLDGLRELLVKRLITMREAPYVVRMAIEIRGVDVPDTISDIKEMLVKDFITQTDIVRFLWPLCERLDESRPYAVNGIRAAFEAGLGKDEIEEVFRPLVTLGTPMTVRLLGVLGD